MNEREIRKGDRVRYRDARGEWRYAFAESGIEGTHTTNPKTGRLRKIHDFPVIWIRTHAAATYGITPWPAEDVELA